MWVLICLVGMEFIGLCSILFWEKRKHNGYFKKLSHVSKAFGTKKVLKDLSLAVPEHSVFGFIGENGAENHYHENDIGAFAPGQRCDRGVQREGDFRRK